MNVFLFLIPIAVGITAQSIKPLFNRNWKTTINFEGNRIPRYGGMPSAHTAFAFSLATIVAMVDGIGSTTFAIVASLVIFVLDDALRMRIFLGRHGEALQLLFRRQPPQIQEQQPPLESHLGHTPSEVVAGATLGVLLTWVIMVVLGT